MATAGRNGVTHARVVRSGSSSLPLVLVAFGLAWVSVEAAGPRVPVRPSPKPEQVIHVTTEQEILLRTGERAEEPGPAQLSRKGVLVYTQSNGRFDAQDRMEAQVTIERLEIDERMAGQQRGAFDTASVKGRIVKVVLDRSGKLLSIKVPPDVGGALSARLTQLLAGAYGVLNFVPDVSLAAGEETTSTTELPMRLPGNLAPGPLEARTTLTLRSIDTQEKDRIARLQHRIEVLTSTSQLSVTGGGTIDVNLDRGFISATRTEWTMSGVLPAASGTAQDAPFHGSIKISVSAN